MTKKLLKKLIMEEKNKIILEITKSYDSEIESLKSKLLEKKQFVDK